MPTIEDIKIYTLILPRNHNRRGANAEIGPKIKKKGVSRPFVKISAY